MNTTQPTVELNEAGQKLKEFDFESGMSLAEVIATLRAQLRLLVLVPLAIGAVVLGVTGLITPSYTATTTFMPPQQSQSGTAALLGSLGPLAALAGGGASAGTSADRYIGLMQSVTLSDRIIDRFKLMEEYQAKFKVDARKILASNVQITVGKKDGMISVAVDDKSPQRAADMANHYVTELRAMNQSLAVTEAQQRRMFFEQQLKLGRDRLVLAQQALQASGFSAGALKTELKAAADSYARLKAEVTTAEVKLQTLRGSLADQAPEVLKQQTELSALREQLARLERASETSTGPDYIGKYRDFKYQETLFEMYARQFEIARVDESREGTLIQVVDPATPPERKSRPKRAATSLVSALVTLLALMVFVLVRHSMRRPAQALAQERPQRAG
jgi:uncharacterized protein involved in exopolysaccharide biosynthesis